MNNDMKKLPMIAMRGLTVFPSTSLHFDVGRKKSIEAIKFALENEGKIVLVSQIDANLDEPTEKDIQKVGTLAIIKHAMPVSNNGYRVLVDGIERVKIENIDLSNPYFLVEYSEYKSSEEDAIMIEGMHRKAIDILKEIQLISPQSNKELLFNLINEKDIEAFIDKTANVFGNNKQQDLLDEKNTTKRLEILLDVLVHEVEIAKVDKIIAIKVKNAVDENQKEFYLREQMKAINEELGEDDEVDELEKRIKNLPIDKIYIKKLLKDFARSKKTPTISPEFSILRNYIEFVCELPWDKFTEDNENLVSAEKILNEDHYGLEKIKERIIEFLAVRRLSDNRKEPIICFVGPPGVGKTSIVKSIARAMDRKYIRMSVGGVRDEAEIRGHRKTYVGAMAGRIISNLKLVGTANPVFLLDEIDKMGSDYKGDPSSALLEVLDPEQNKSFRDNYLELPFDLSKVLFITTANSIDTIPSPLLDRMEIIEMSGYTPLEKKEIALRHLIPKQLENNGLKDKNITITNNALMAIIENYTRESGVRGLEKQLSKLFRKIARQYVELLDTNKKSAGFKITTKNIEKYLGVPYFKRNELENIGEIGATTGLAWTSVGGEVLTIEASIMDGKGDIILTGKLGEVMQESAKIAVSYIRKNYKKYNINSKAFEKKDIHIHVPEGAVPKDGPSAGVTIATSILSAVTNKKVRGDIAMTGEITLRGKVLPIGGLKEKTLAAHRFNKTTVIIPSDNEKDIKELPEIIKKELQFVFAKNIDDVFAVAFEK